jgi:hypothetical protein
LLAETKPFGRCETTAVLPTGLTTVEQSVRRPVQQNFATSTVTDNHSACGSPSAISGAASTRSSHGYRLTVGIKGAIFFLFVLESFADL